MAKQQFLQVLPTTLFGSGVSLTDTSITVSAFRYPNGEEVPEADLGTKNFATIGTGSQQEIIQFTDDITKNTNGTTTLNDVTRGLDFGPPYTTVSGNRRAHAGGVSFVLSNNPQLYENLASNENDEDVTGEFTFTAPKYPRIDDPNNLPTEDAQFAPKKYVDDKAFAGANLDKLIVDAIAGGNVAENDVVYFDEGDKEWKKAIATFVNQADYKVGIAMGVGTDGNAILGGVLLRGTKGSFTGLSQGEPYFLSDTAGEIGTTVGTITFELGYAKSAAELYFFPKFKSYITKDQKDALAGTDGTPSSSNKYVTGDDVATTGSGKVIRSKGDGILDDSLLALTTAGDIVYSDGTNLKKLAIGTAGQGLGVNSGATALEWGGIDFKTVNKESFGAGNNLIAAADTERNTTSRSYVKVKEIEVHVPGTLRFTFDMKSNGAGAGLAQVYRNGVAVGVEKSEGGTSYQFYSDDISGWSSGDLAQLYIKTSNNSGVGLVKLFRIKMGGFSLGEVNMD